MKKLFLLLIAVPTIVFAQEKKEEKTSDNKEIALSLNVNVSDPVGLGLFVEFPSKKDQILNLRSSEVIYINYAMGSLKNDITQVTIDGNGYECGIGQRTYFNKNNNKNFYFENFLTYGEVKFNSNYLSGKYSYISLINPDLGYKLKIAKVINFEVNAGFMWKWEMLKGQGDIDNKMFDNLVPKFGLKLGYIF